MSLLTVVQQFCLRSAINKPATVYGTTDAQVLQVMALLEEEGEELASRGPWEQLTLEATHTTTAAEDQGDIDTIATNGFRYILHDTIWDRTNQWPLYGPVAPHNYQANKAWTITGPRTEWRLRGNHLIVYPAPAASLTWAFEYVSKNWIVDTGGTTYANLFAADTDVILLPEELVLKGLRWRWMREKGLDYGELFRSYEMEVKDALGRNGSKPTLHMDRPHREGFQPGIFVSSGSWDL